MAALFCIDLFVGGFDMIDFKFSVSVAGQSVQGVRFVEPIELSGCEMDEVSFHEMR